MRSIFIIILPLFVSSYVIRQPPDVPDSSENAKRVGVEVDHDDSLIPLDDPLHPAPTSQENGDHRIPFAFGHHDDALSKGNDDVIEFTHDDDDFDAMAQLNDDVVKPEDDDLIDEDDVTNRRNVEDEYDVIEMSYELVNGVLCHKCAPGYGVVTVCDPHGQTVCQPCVVGANYTSVADGWHFRPCQPCSRCGRGMFVEAACTASADTFCDSCDAALTEDGAARMVKSSEDYRLKCSQVASELGSVEKSKSSEQLLPSGEVKSKENIKTSAKFEKFSRDIENVYGKDVPILLNEYKDEVEKLQPEISAESLPIPLVAIDSINMDLAQENHRTENDHMKEDGRLEIQLLPDHIAGIQSPWQNAAVNKNKKEGFKSTTGYQTSSDSNPEGLVITKSPLLVLGFENLLGSKSEKDLLINEDAADKPFDPFDASPKNPEDRGLKGVLYKPSSHSYPYEELVHPSVFAAFHLKQHRKLIVLFVISICLIALILFTLNLLRKQSKLDSKKRQVVFATDLTDFDNKIIKDCAQKMEQSQKRFKKQRSNRCNPFQDQENEDESNSSMNVLENPLLNYLDENPRPANSSADNLLDKINKKPGIVNL